MKKLLLFLLFSPLVLIGMEGAKKQCTGSPENKEKKRNVPMLANLVIQALGGTSNINQEEQDTHWAEVVSFLCDIQLPIDQAMHILYQLPKNIVNDYNKNIESWFDKTFQCDEESKKRLKKIINIVGEPREKFRFKDEEDEEQVYNTMDPHGLYIVDKHSQISSTDAPDEKDYLCDLEGDYLTAFDCEGKYFVVANTENSGLCLFKKRDSEDCWDQDFTYLSEDYERHIPPKSTQDLYDKENVLKKYKPCGRYIGLQGFSPQSNYFVARAMGISMEMPDMGELWSIEGKILLADSLYNSVWTGSESHCAYSAYDENKCRLVAVVEMDNEKKIVRKKYTFPNATGAAINELSIAIGYKDGSIKLYALNDLTGDPIACINSGAESSFLKFSFDSKFLIAQVQDTIIIYSIDSLLKGEEPKAAEHRIVKCDPEKNICYFDINKNDDLVITFQDCVKVFSLKKDLDKPVVELDYKMAWNPIFLGNFLYISVYSSGEEVLLRFSKNNIKDINPYLTVQSCGENPYISRDERYILVNEECENEDDLYYESFLWHCGISEQEFFNLDVQERTLIIELVTLQQEGKNWPQDVKFPQDILDRLPEIVKDRLKDVIDYIGVSQIRTGKEEI